MVVNNDLDALCVVCGWFPFFIGSLGEVGVVVFGLISLVCRSVLFSQELSVEGSIVVVSIVASIIVWVSWSGFGVGFFFFC